MAEPSFGTPGTAHDPDDQPSNPISLYNLISPGKMGKLVASRKEVSREYLGLIRRFPLRPIRSDRELTSVRYVDNCGDVAERYPANPNGSPRGIAGLTNKDGRITIMMPHPERVFRTAQHSWHPSAWGENSPWQKLFTNARDWVDANF